MTKLLAAGAALAALVAFAPAAANADRDAAKRTDLILGGTPVTINQFPSAAEVFGPGVGCAATVISARHVLTAAHCIDVPTAPASYRVITGRTNLRDKATGQEIPVAQAFVSADFRDAGKYRGHDLAVLALESPTTSPPAVLATPSEGKRATKAGKRLTIAGWGLTTLDQDSSSFTQLNALTVSSLRAKRCKGYGKAFRPGVMGCTFGARNPAVGGRRSTCRGDSGASYVAQTPAGARIVGLDSFGSLVCGAKKQPTVFASFFDRYARSFIAGALATPLP